VCGDIYVCTNPPEDVQFEEWVTTVRMQGYVAGGTQGGTAELQVTPQNET
jgi:hypothetical protein